MYNIEPLLVDSPYNQDFCKLSHRNSVHGNLPNQDIFAGPNWLYWIGRFHCIRCVTIEFMSVHTNKVEIWVKIRVYVTSCKSPTHEVDMQKQLSDYSTHHDIQNSFGGTKVWVPGLRGWCAYTTCFIIQSYLAYYRYRGKSLFLCVKLCFYVYVAFWRSYNGEIRSFYHPCDGWSLYFWFSCGHPVYWLQGDLHSS